MSEADIINEIRKIGRALAAQNAMNHRRVMEDLAYIMKNQSLIGKLASDEKYFEEKAIDFREHEENILKEISKLVEKDHEILKGLKSKKTSYR